MEQYYFSSIQALQPVSQMETTQVPETDHDVDVHGRLVELISQKLPNCDAETRDLQDKALSQVSEFVAKYLPQMVRIGLGPVGALFDSTGVSGAMAPMIEEFKEASLAYKAAFTDRVPKEEMDKLVQSIRSMIDTVAQGSLDSAI